jgi:hypothetical protein
MYQLSWLVLRQLYYAYLYMKDPVLELDYTAFLIKMAFLELDHTASATYIVILHHSMDIQAPKK